MAGEDEGFLKRWSRLKQEGDAADPEAPPEASPDATPAGLPASLEGDEVGEGEEATAQELDLPDIESLDKDSDYTGFLREGVPDVLRRMAMRKLWLSDPVLANLDGLNDYDEDFAALFKTVGDAVQKVSDAAKKSGDGDKEGAQEEVAAVEDADAPEPEPVDDSMGDDDDPAEMTSAADSGDDAVPAPARKPSSG